MSENGVNHTDGICDNCGARGKLGWVVGYRDLSHRHACTKPECRAALERADETTNPLAQPWSVGYMAPTSE